MNVESLPNFTQFARQRWDSIPADIRQRLLANVWCGQCRHEVTITNFSPAVRSGGRPCRCVVPVRSGMDRSGD
jgi:hypothetical protein